MVILIICLFIFVSAANTSVEDYLQNYVNEIKRDDEQTKQFIDFCNLYFKNTTMLPFMEDAARLRFILKHPRMSMFMFVISHIRYT